MKLTSKIPEPELTLRLLAYLANPTSFSKQFIHFDLLEQHGNFDIKKFVKAGSRGGKASQKRGLQRDALICELVRNELLVQPTDLKISAVNMAYNIHDLFEKEIARFSEKYGDKLNFGSQDNSLSKPYLEYLTTRIRKLVKRNGRKLCKSSSNMWDPAPDVISIQRV